MRNLIFSSINSITNIWYSRVVFGIHFVDFFPGELLLTTLLLFQLIQTILQLVDVRV